MSEACFTAADILLPAAGVPLDPWACIAVDQFTSQPEYWQRAEHLADGKPSTLHIVLPEAYLGTPQEAERLESIRRTMEEYRKSVLTRKVHGYVYVERTQMDGTVRQGLVGAVDLDAYDYAKGSKPAIRPSESTVVERIPPRLKVRRGATLETPHVMMLADDADCTLIEPIGLMKNQLPPLYDGELMLGGGHLRGWAVEDPALIAGIDAALAALEMMDFEGIEKVRQRVRQNGTLAQQLAQMQAQMAQLTGLLEVQKKSKAPKLSGPAQELSTAAMARAMKTQKGEMR